MKKYDILLAGAIIMIALVWFLINVNCSEKGAVLQVYINNEPSGAYLLSEDIEQPIYNNEGKEIQLFVIKNGTADVTYADCPDGLCVHQKAISKTGETIVCLPNKIVLKVEGGAADSNDADGSLDAVVY